MVVARWLQLQLFLILYPFPPVPNEHTWRETTPEGEKREVRATKFAGKWKLQSKLKDDPGWTYHDQPDAADLDALRDLIFRKYQRKRASYEDLQSVERMIVESRNPH